MPFDSGGAANLTFSRDGRRIAAGSRHGAIEIWDVKTGKPTLQRQGHRTRLQASAISRDGRYAVTCDIDEKIIAWSFPEGRKIGQVTARDLHPRALMFDASGDRIHALGAKHCLLSSRSGRPTSAAA
jgi:WD40 repeat protein